VLFTTSFISHLILRTFPSTLLLNAGQSKAQKQAKQAAQLSQ